MTDLLELYDLALWGVSREFKECQILLVGGDGTLGTLSLFRQEL